MGASLVQCYSIRQMLYIFHKQNMVVLMMLLRIHHCWSGAQCAWHCTRENSLAWKSFQSKHGCRMDIDNEKKCYGNSYTGCPSNLPIKCML